MSSHARDMPKCPHRLMMMVVPTYCFVVTSAFSRNLPKAMFVTNCTASRHASNDWAAKLYEAKFSKLPEMKITVPMIQVFD